MVRLTIFVISLLTLGLTTFAATPALAEGPNILQIFVIDVDTEDRDAYLARIKALDPIIQRLGLPNVRVWQGSYAGDSTGRLVVAVEQTDLAAFAANSGKILNDAEFKKWQADLAKADISELVSQSMWVEVTP
jgi:hypothetical protein